MVYFIQVEYLVDDGIDFVGNGFAVGGGEVADAADGRLEHFFLVELLKAVLNVLPKVVYESLIVGDEVGQGRHDVEAVSLHVVDAFVVLHY